MSASGRIWRRARQSRAVLLSGGMLLCLLVVAILGPLLSPHNYLHTDFDNILRAPSFAWRTPVRHRRPRSRPVRAHAARRAGHDPGRARRECRQSGHRRSLRRDRGPCGRARRCRHDALRRYAVCAAVHLFRHPVDGRVRAQFLPHLRRDRRRQLARHGAHRARPDAQPARARVRAGGTSSAASPSCTSLCGTSRRTSLASLSST